jgi:hypothetical protein
MCFVRHFQVLARTWFVEPIGLQLEITWCAAAETQVMCFYGSFADCFKDFYDFY